MRTLPQKTTALQARVLRLLKKKAQKNKVAISYNELDAILAMPRSSIQRALEYLERKDYIYVELGSSHRKNVITIKNRTTQEKV